MPSFTQLEFRNILPDTDEAFVAYDADDGFRLFKEVQDGIAVYFKEITEITPASELLQFAGNATVLGSTTVKLENVTILNANQTVSDSTYTISRVGNSNFIALGAFDNIPGVTFTANAVVGSGTGKLVSNVIQDENIVAGRLYKILFLGTTNWNTAAGTTGVTYKVGDWIVAAVNGAGAGAGTGTVASDFSYLTSQVGQIIKVGSTWARINKFIDEQTVQVDRPVTAGAVYVPRYYPDVLLDTIIGKVTAELSGTNVVSGSFVVGKEYIIVSLGNTTQANWNTAAGTTGITYAVGDSFKAATAGVVTTGVAAPKYAVPPQTAFNVTSALVDKYYEITTLGTTNWNSIAGTTGVTYIVGNVVRITNQNLITGTGTVKRAYPAKPITVGKTYQIVDLGTTNWNTVAGTTGVIYEVGSEFTVVTVPTAGNGIVSFYNIERYYESTTEVAQGDTTKAGTYIGEPRLDSAGILKIWDGSAWVAASSNSRVVDLTASSQVFTYNSAGTSPTPASVTLTATASNTSGTVYYAFHINDNVTAAQNTTSNTYVLTAPGSIANTKVEVRLREGTDNSTVLARDQTTIIGVQPGASGTNAIVGYLTNENHTVAADSAGAGYTLTSAGGTFNMFNGTTNVTGTTTFTITGSTDSGGTLAITQNGLTFTLTKATGAYVLTGNSPSWTTNIEIFTVTGTFNSVPITQVYTITKARAGTNGSNGLNNATVAIYTRSATAPTVPAGTYTYTFSSGTFLVNPTGWTTAFPTAGANPVYVAYAVASGSTATVNITTFSTPVLLVQNGTNGTNGTPAVNLNLSVSSMTVSAYADGGVTSFAGVEGQCTVFEGTTDVTANAGVVFTFTATNCTGSVNTATNNPVTGAKGSYRITAMTADTAFLTITATYNTIAYTRVFSVSKNKVGYEILSADPSSNLFQGRIYFNTVTNKLRRYTGTVWTNAVDTTDLSGTITAAQIGAIIGGDNLLQNSSLESVNTGNNVPYGFAIYNNAGISTTVTQVAGRLGGNALSIRANASTTDTLGVFGNSTLTGSGITGGIPNGWKPNTTYVVSFYARKVNGAGFLKMFLGWNPPAPTVVDIANPTVTTTFQRYAFRITWGATVEANGGFFISVDGTKATNDQIIIDDIQITEGDAEVLYAPRTGEILPNSVTNAQIAGIEAAKLTTQITNTNIADNAITSPKITANTITASRMVLTDTSNLVMDAEFAEGFGATQSWQIALGTVTQVTSDVLTTALVAPKVAKITGNGTGTANRYDYIINSRVPVEPNKPFAASVDTAVTVGFNGLIYADIEWFNAAGGTISYSTVGSGNYLSAAAGSTITSLFSNVLTAPAAAVNASLRLIVDWNSDFATRNKAGTAGFARPRMRRATNAELIVDGAITAGKIFTGAVTTDKLDAGAVTAGKISARAITADKLLVVGSSLWADPGFKSPALYAVGQFNGSTFDWFNTGTLTGTGPHGWYYEQTNSIGLDSYIALWSGRAGQDNTKRYFCYYPYPSSRTVADLVPATPGRVYEIAFTGQNNSNQALEVLVEFYTNNLTYVSTLTPIVVASASGFTNANYRGQFTAPATAAVMHFRFGNAGTPTPLSGSMIIGNVTVREAASASMIVDGAITAGKIFTGAVTADKIEAGAVTAGKIAANSITANRLLIADTNNYSENPSFQMGNSGWFTDTAQWGIVSDAGNAYAGSFVARKTTTGTDVLRNGYLVRVLPGDALYARAWLKASAGAVASSLYVRIVCYNDALNVETPTIGNHVGVPTTYTLSEVSAVVPAGCFWARVEVVGVHTAGTLYAGTVGMFRRASSNLIVDGSITAAKISTNAVTADKILAGEITGAKIAGTTITGANIAGDTITGNKIQAGAITASKLTLTNNDDVFPDSSISDPFYHSGGQLTAFTGTFGGASHADGFANQPRRSFSVSGTLWPTYATTPITVEAGATYRVKLRIYRPAGVTGHYGSFFHLPGAALVLPGANTTNPNEAGWPAINVASLTADTWITYSSVNVASNAYSYIQMYHNHVSLSGTIYVQWEITRAASADLIVDGAITANKISVSSLSAVSATVGTLRTATSGARVEIKDNIIEVYDATRLRVRLGIWT